MTAPKAEDLAAAGPDTYLDYPGNPRDLGCSYERWYRAYMDGYEPTVYARVAEADTGPLVSPRWCGMPARCISPVFRSVRPGARYAVLCAVEIRAVHHLRHATLTDHVWHHSGNTAG